MEFITEHILLIATIAAFIIFAIIGYVVDKSKNQSKKEKEILKEQVPEEITPNIDIPVEKAETTEIKGKNIDLDDLNK